MRRTGSAGSARRSARKSAAPSSPGGRARAEVHVLEDDADAPLAERRRAPPRASARPGTGCRGGRGGPRAPPRRPAGPRRSGPWTRGSVLAGAGLPPGRHLLRRRTAPGREKVPPAGRDPLHTFRVATAGATRAPLRAGNHVAGRPGHPEEEHAAPRGTRRPSACALQLETRRDVQADGEEDAEREAERRHDPVLEQEVAEDVRPLRAEGAARPDLARPLGDREGP